MATVQKPILVIFKTHLDIGFTDYAQNIVSNYLNTFIPNAIRVGYELKGTDTPFIWTAGSWLLDQALKQDEDGMVEKAIRDGILHWHGLPFTSHTEAMNPALFQYGLDISRRLDERFGRKTIGAKMTDVPGHTIGMVPLMKRAGLRFLHIGINPATPVPPVPALFRWKCGEDEIVVMYHGDYGELMDFRDFAVCFAHTGDNQGPQSKETIIAVYDDLRRRYPDCKLQAATLDDLAEWACSVPHLPVLENEIGDTWIHGVATDPGKVSRYRRLLRVIEEKGTQGKDLTDNLLLVPEHTWGMDLKTFFRDEAHYTHQELEQAAAERMTIERSWQEQRAYVDEAEKRLGVDPEELICEPEMDGYEPADCADPGIEITWQIFGRQDYERYQTDYMRLTEANAGWALWDFTKMGLKNDQGGSYQAKVTEAYVRGNERLFKLTFAPEAVETYGVPYFWLHTQCETIELTWFGKKASRLPQACYLKFKGYEEQWELHKMGQWIIPEEVIGSPLLSAVDRGIRNREFMIESLDAPLIAPFGKKLLHYAQRRCPQDMHFILYNNIWNTNFPMWYSDDAMFRFRVMRGK